MFSGVFGLPYKLASLLILHKTRAIDIHFSQGVYILYVFQLHFLVLYCHNSFATSLFLLSYTLVFQWFSSCICLPLFYPHYNNFIIIYR